MSEDTTDDGCHACMEISATGHEDANGLPHTCEGAGLVQVSPIVQVDGDDLTVSCTLAPGVLADAVRDGLRARLGAPVSRAPWQPGDPEPTNAYPFHIHAAPCPSADPWATLCERRVPRSALATHPAQVDCPGCGERMAAGGAVGMAYAIAEEDVGERNRERVALEVEHERKACLADVKFERELLMRLGGSIEAERALRSAEDRIRARNKREE